MDKASAYGAGVCRFESCRGHVAPASSTLFLFTSKISIQNLSFNGRAIAAAFAQLPRILLCCSQETPARNWLLRARHLATPGWATHFSLCFLLPRKAGLLWAGVRGADCTAGLFELGRRQTDKQETGRLPARLFFRSAAIRLGSGNRSTQLARGPRATKFW